MRKRNEEGKKGQCVKREQDNEIENEPSLRSSSAYELPTNNNSLEI